MNSKKLNKTRFIFVLLAVLAYSVQSSAFVGNMNELESFSITEPVMSGCHDHASLEPTAVNNSADCCDDGCFMMDCHHGASLLLGYISTRVFNAHQTQSPDASIGFVTKRSNSLYRPPILR